MIQLAAIGNPICTAPEAVRNGSQESQSKLSPHRSAIARFGSFEDGRAQQPHIASFAPSVQVRNREVCGLVLFRTTDRINRIVVVRYRIHLESCCLAANTINQHLAAVRRLAHEAADVGLLSPDLAAGIARVKGVKRLGQRSGKWLTQDQSADVLRRSRGESLRAKRDYAMLTMLFGCGLRRSELAGLEVDDIQTRQGHWAIVDLIGKGGHVRTVPIPHWAKQALDEWTSAAGISKGRIFRAVARTGMVWGSGISENVVWSVVRSCCQRAGLEHIAPHDLRRTCAKQCHTNGGELEQIQFLLGHASVLTTERYLGCKQNLGHPVNDLFDLKTNVQTQEAGPASAPAQATEVKAPSHQDANSRGTESDLSSGDVHERLVLRNEPRSVRNNDSDSTRSNKGFVTEWDGAA